MASLGQVAVVSAMWAAPGQRGGPVEVLGDGWVVPHFGARASFAHSCTAGTYHRDEYVALMLLGKTLKYSTDISATGCGCSAALSLLPLRQSSDRSQCSDYYCDASNTCGNSCAEIAVQQSNQHAWSTQLRLHDDARGVSVGYGSSVGDQDQAAKQYAPGASCIDTSKPFDVAVSFPVDEIGELEAVEVALSQAGKSCPLSARLDKYAAGGMNGLSELSKVLIGGVTPVVSYSSSRDLQTRGQWSCTEGKTGFCPEYVRFYDFIVENYTRSSSTSSMPSSSLSADTESHGSQEYTQAAAHGALAANRFLELPVEEAFAHKHRAASPKASTRGSSAMRGAAGVEMLGDSNGVTDNKYEGALEWEVVYDGALNVRAEKDFDADIINTKLEGTIVVGRREGDWLALIREPGYMRMDLEDKVLLRKRVVSYARLTHGSCADAEQFPILDPDTCQNAGFALGYFDTTVGIYHGALARPEGCYEYQGQLWLSTNAAQIGRGLTGERKPICSSRAYPTTTTTTTTTSTTSSTLTSTTTSRTSTSTTSTTWGWPSLFCVSVVRTKGYELPLVQAQQRARCSIFTCDEYSVFSDGGDSEEVGIGPDGLPIMTIVIPPIKESVGDLHKGATTDSWLNTKTFLQVWDLAKKDGKFEKHDWTVKVDPDAVFFPARLRNEMAPHTQPDGPGLFVMNCDKYNPIALYGSLEIFSKKALQTYVARQWTCRNDLPWHGWGEDFFMSHCMDRLGLQRVYNFKLIGDKRCHFAPCSDTSKVVYHDYKGIKPWFTCYNASLRASGTLM